MENRVYPYSADFEHGLLWYKSLASYYGNQERLLDCGAYKGDKGYTWFANFIGYKGGSYGYNGFGTRSTAYLYYTTDEVLGLGGDRPYLGGPASLGQVPDHLIRVPSDMIAMGDSMMTPFGATGYLLTMTDGHKTDPRRHNGGSNIAFADGHSESIRNEALVSTNDLPRRRWNNDHEPHLGE